MVINLDPLNSEKENTRKDGEKVANSVKTRRAESRHKGNKFRTA